LKVVQGTYQKSRANPNEPKPKRGIPAPKKGLLSKNAKKHYIRVAEILDGMQILTEADVITLELLALHLDDYFEARELVKTQGRIYGYKNAEGNPVIKRHPALLTMNESMSTILTLLSRFGLDPSSRTKIVAISEKEGNQWSEF